MAPPPPLPSMPATSGPQSNHSSQSSSLPATPQQPDLFAELLRLGLNPDDLAKQSSIRPQVREEVVKNLQAILGKKDSADLLRKLMPLRNEWPTTNTTTTATTSTPPDYHRNNNGPVGGSGGSKDNILGSSILSGAGGGTGGTMSFTDHINNGNSSQQQEQDAQYASAQQQHLRQAVASSVNHHQHFRIPTRSSAMHNSPLQQQQQQQQMLSQHKSVLSLHHQHHLTHPHQADPAHRQRLNQQHKLNSLPNSSITNLNDIKGASSTSISSSNQALLDAKSVNIFNHRSSPAISPYTLPAAGSTPRVPSIMDALNGQPSLDNMHDNSPLHQQMTMNNRDKLKSMARHQQMQKQFRTNAEKHKNLQWPNQAGSTSNLNLGSEPQITQRTIGSSNNTGSMNHLGLSQLQRQLTSPISSAISPPQATPGLPKSLLNLAACSSSPPYTSNVNQMSSNSRNQVSNLRSANANQFGNSIIPANNRAVARNDIDTASNQKTTPIADPTSLLHQMMKSSSGNKNLSVNSNSRSNYSNFSLSSLLSEDQSRSNNNNIRSNTYQNTSSLANYQAGAPLQRRPSSAKSDESSLLQGNSNSKDPYALYLRDRTAKAGISSGKVNQARDNVDHPSRLQNVLMAQPQSIEPLDESQDDIDTALSRVEARNDLSLLYPPVSLASNSQKQINSLSAGIQLPGELDQFTDEIKKIVQEDCNIIYECKICSNLFRSLANLVKHKRLYCKEDKDKTIQLELNRRSNISAMSNLDMSVTKSSRDSTFSRQILSREGDESETNLPMDGQPRLQEEQPVPNGLQKYNLRGKRVDVSFLVGNSRSSRSSKNQDRFKDTASQQSPNTKNYAENHENSAGQTYLSRLLQSQPRNRVSPMKDSALMDALSVAPAIPTNRSMIVNNSLSKFNEQLVRNSSLAKTLLSENVKSINVNQSNSATTNIIDNSVQGQKSSTPKRKLLEDCISKVKRDKMGPSESASCDSTLVESHLSPMATSQDESEQYRDPLEINDSGADSDALVMDIDCGNTAGDNDKEPENKADHLEGTDDKSFNDGEDKDADCQESITEELSAADDAETNANDISSEDVADDEAATQDAVVKTEVISGMSVHGDCNDEIKIDDDEHGNQSNNGEQEDEEEVQEEEDDVDEEDEGDEEDGDDGDEGDDEDNEEDNDDEDDEDEDGDCDDSDAGESSSAMVPTIKSERKSSYCSSTRSESDPNSSDIRDKNSKHKYHDNASSHISSRSSSKSSVSNTMDGAGGCKLILKTALAGSSRDGSGGSGSGASTSSGIPGSSGGGSGGSIMKVKIQLKTQPDEKSKVYRIVE